MAENDSYQIPSTTPADSADMTNAATPSEPAETAGWHSPTQGGITTPIAPEGGIPAYPGNMNQTGNENAGIMLPIETENTFPAYPGNMNCPSCGSCPSCPTLPIYPTIPSVPSYQYGQVRFINASTNTFPVNFSIDGTTYVPNSQFGNVSAYQPVSDGFHTVSINRTTGLQALLLQQTFPFTSNQKVTMVLTDAKEGGLELIQVSDVGCTNLPSGYGCYRVANMSYSGSSFDVQMYNGDTVFRNVSFTQVTSYKRALAGNYTFYLSNATFYQAIRELPIIILGAITGANPMPNPLASGNVTIQAGQNTTTYIIGNTWSAYSLRMLTVND